MVFWLILSTLETLLPARQILLVIIILVIAHLLGVDLVGMAWDAIKEAVVREVSPL